MTSGLGDVIKLVKSSTPMKTFGEVNDIAWAAVYLASEEAKFGSVIAYADLISPFSNGSSHCFFCSSVPTLSSTPCRAS